MPVSTSLANADPLSYSATLIFKSTSGPLLHESGRNLRPTWSDKAQAFETAEEYDSLCRQPHLHPYTVQNEHSLSLFNLTVYSKRSNETCRQNQGEAVQ